MLDGEAGTRILLLGNEAISRGALEAGVDYATTYPGTPATEIGDTLHAVAQRAGITFEYGVNEKVALETAGGAAFCGLNALVSMKHVGLNVASDALMSLAYSGVTGGLVIVTADDPGCYSSQNEQDNRLYARLANLPMLEPATPKQAYEMTIEAFRISHALQMPIILRTTTRVSHARGPVVLGPLVKQPPRRGRFEPDPEKFVIRSPRSREIHRRLLERMKRASSLAETSGFNRVEVFDSQPTFGVISSGVGANYVRDALANQHGALLHLGFTHPLPKTRILDFLRRFEQVAVVEELEPYLEEGIRAIAHEGVVLTKIWGKSDGLFPRYGELNPDLVRDGLATLGWTEQSLARQKDEGLLVPLPRPPVMCPGCGHRPTGYAVKKAARRKDVVFTTDIGCYLLTTDPPISVGDTKSCMGASISTASGIASATGKRVVALIGDSTFYHAGIPALINAVHHGHNIVVVIMDNSTTAMTGQQPHPGVSDDGLHKVVLEDLVKGCGVDSVRVVDPFDVGGTEKAFKMALEDDGIHVVISRHLCRLLENRDIERELGSLPLYTVDRELCTLCGYCIDAFGCPAFRFEPDGHLIIDPALCTGCAVCVEICPPKAIVEVGRAGG